MKLNFDKLGYLTPYKAIETDLDVLEENFIFNDHRRWLFEHLLLLVEKLIKHDIEEQIALFWVNGSFVTKKELPRDIDTVIFVEHGVFMENLEHLRSLQSQLYGKMDFYFEPHYPENHRLHPVGLILKND